MMNPLCVPACAVRKVLWVAVLLAVTGFVQADSITERWKKAINNNRVEELSRLIDESPTTELAVTKSASGKTALMIACKLGEQQLVNRLLGFGADVHASTATGGTPVMFASLGGHVGLVRQLIELDVDLDAQGSNGWTALTIAAAKGNAELLSVLIEQQADINVRDIYRWTPLMRAVDNLHFEAVQVLLKQTDIELDVQDEAGNTALHHAVAHDAVKFAKVLIERGASESVSNTAGFNVSELADELGSNERMRSLLRSARQ